MSHLKNNKIFLLLVSIIIFSSCKPVTTDEKLTATTLETQDTINGANSENGEYSAQNPSEALDVTNNASNGNDVYSSPAPSATENYADNYDGEKIEVGYDSETVDDALYHVTKYGNRTDISIDGEFKVYYFFIIQAEPMNKNFLGYKSEFITKETFVEDTIEYMKQYSGIDVTDIWYEGERICINLDYSEGYEFDKGSYAGAMRTNVVIRTLSSYPNVKEIQILLDYQKGAMADHFNFDRIYKAIELD